MVIIKPIATSQSINQRVRPHTLEEYLFVLDSDFGGVDCYVETALDYSDGKLSGSITLPLTNFNEQKRNFRIVACDSTNPTILDILNNDGASYGLEEWIELIEDLIEEGGIEKEVFRGSMLITDQTDLDKYKLYG